MSPPRRPWFRFYTETMRDMKIRRLTPAERWVWAGLLSAARESCLPGVLMLNEQIPLSDEELAGYCDTPIRVVRSALTKAAALGMVERDGSGALRVPRFAARQYESDLSTGRATKHRSNNGDATAMQRPNNGDATSPENREQRTEKSKPLPTPPSATPARQDLLWDALIEACGIDSAELTKPARGAVNAARKFLADVGANPAEIHVRADRYRRTWPNVSLTPSALVKHWATLTKDPAPIQRRDNLAGIREALEA